MTNGTSGSALPGLNLAAPPGQRLASLELAREIERRGFSSVSVASPFGVIGQCAGLGFFDPTDHLRERDCTNLCADGR
jgi:hypothetical protein